MSVSARTLRRVQRLRIALVILHADAARGGAERYTFDLAAALTKAGHHVSLLASSFAQVPPGVTRVELRATGLTRTRRYRAFLDSLDAHLDQAKYDIIHAMLPVRRCDVYHPHAGLAVAAVKQKPIGAIFNPRRGAFATVERELISSANPPIVLALSNYVKQAIEQFYPLGAERLRVLFNAVDTDRFTASANPTRNTVNALIIAQDFVRKGLAQTIDALALVNDKRLRLTVVGKGSHERYRKQSAACGVADRITFAGETTDTRSFYDEADFFVLPTTHDPCSLVVLEALAMGLPVISTKFNGATEVMTDGVHGFILDDPTDVPALADRMRRLLDPELRARMSRACIDLRPKLAYEHHLSTLLAIYSRIIAERKSHV